jgi:hypothetical protein
MIAADLIRAELAKFRSRIANDRDPLAAEHLTIVETGSIRNDDPAYEVDDGWSTLTFAEDVNAHEYGRLYSIDLDISTAERVLRQRDALTDHVTLIEGYSIDVLAELVGLGFLDFAADVLYLDSDNDGQLILHEYLVARRFLKTPGLVMVDDISRRSPDVRKGHELIPWLDRAGVGYRIEQRTARHFRTGVLIIET